jgi:hypothetical protein
MSVLLKKLLFSGGINSGKFICKRKNGSLFNVDYISMTLNESKLILNFADMITLIFNKTGTNTYYSGEYGGECGSEWNITRIN